MDNLKKKQEKETPQSVSYLQAYSGPLPTPESLYKYEQVLPGAAERIIAMAEKQADHRMEMMRKRANTTILMVVLSTVSDMLGQMLQAGQPVCDHVNLPFKSLHPQKQTS